MSAGFPGTWCAHPEPHWWAGPCLGFGVLASEDTQPAPSTCGLTTWHPENLPSSLGGKVSAGLWGPAASSEMSEAPDCLNPNSIPGFACSFHSSSPKGVTTIFKNPTSQDLFCCVVRVTSFLEPGWTWMGCSAPQSKESSAQTHLSSWGDCQSRCCVQGPGSPIGANMYGSDLPLRAGPSCCPAEAVVVCGTTQEGPRNEVIRDHAFPAT